MNCLIKRQYKRSMRGFTLVELIVASSMTVLILSLVFQMISSSRSIILTSSSKSDAAARSRAILFRIGLDLENRITMPQSHVQILKKNGNDEMTFVSRVSPNSISTSDLRGISLVAYRISIEDNPNHVFLERSAVGFPWTGTTSLFDSGQWPSVSDADYAMLVDGVLRFEVSYVDSDGVVDNSMSDLAPRLPDNASGVVVTVAAIDADIQQNLSADDIAYMQSILVDPDNAETALETWTKNVNELGALPGLRNKLLRSVKIQQRFYTFDS